MSRNRARRRPSEWRRIQAATAGGLQAQSIWEEIVPECIWAALISQRVGWRKGLGLVFELMQSVHTQGCEEAGTWSGLQKMSDSQWFKTATELGTAKWGLFKEETECLWRDVDREARSSVFGLAGKARRRREEDIYNALMWLGNSRTRNTAILLTVPITNELLLGKLKSMIDNPCWEDWENLVDGPKEWQGTASKTRSSIQALWKLKLDPGTEWSKQFWDSVADIGECEWVQTAPTLAW